MTGTTGILKTHYDGFMWEARIRKEDAVHAHIHNPDGFAMRNALRRPPPTEPPHRILPRRGAGLDVAELGWDPAGPRAKELFNCMEHLEAIPRGRYPLPETTQHVTGWALSSSSRPARAQSLPSFGDAETLVESSRELVREAAKTRAQRREAKLAKAEANISQALARSQEFHNRGQRGVYRPLGETDVTTFQNFFYKSTGGIQLHQATPSNKPVLRTRDNNLAPPWQP